MHFNEFILDFELTYFFSFIRGIQKVGYTQMMQVKNILLRNDLQFIMTHLQHTFSLHSLLIAGDICRNVPPVFRYLEV